jgi:branched-subunit amino acid aminotransferase/4-amino-4-deoxychorismate lyase
VDRAARGRGLQDRPAAPGLHRAHRDRLHAGGRALSQSAEGPAPPVWVDGRLLDAGAADGRAPDAAGCYTTARVRGGEATFRDRHVARLQRDARALGLPLPDAEAIARAFRALGRAVFGGGEGIVRLEASVTADGRGVLLASARPFDEGPAAWRVATAPFPHPGPAEAPGAKLSERPAWSRARALARDTGVDDVLMFDAAGRLVEGGRTNLVVVDAGGRAGYPAPALGAVAGLGLGVLLDAALGLAPTELDRTGLARAREVAAVNAVRGVRPIVAIDGVAVGDGRPGPRAAEWAAAFEAALQAGSRSAR